MKKVLKFIVILIVILLVGYLILCATSPADLKVERTATINAPKAVVWEQVVNLDNWNNWSPWIEQDTTTVTTISGPERQPGQTYEYKSTQMGEGKITTTAIEGDILKYDMDFIKPFENHAKGWVKVEGNDGSVTVTHHFEGPTKFIMRGMNTLFGKKFMEKQFDRGLQLLKEYSESGKAGSASPAMPKLDIVEATFPATTFATIRKTVKFTEMDSFYSQSYEALGKAAGASIKGNAHSITYAWDEANGQGDMAAAFPVSAAVAGMTMVNIPESKGYMVKYTGPYSGFYTVHGQIAKYAAENGLTDPLVVEEYIAMPPQVTDSNKFVTHIYYLKK